MKTGYGLSNYWSIEDGFVYHGHNGGVEGGLTEMSYMPDYSVGYFFSINSGNGDAFEKVGKAIRAYITHKLQKPPVPAAAPLPAGAQLNTPAGTSPIRRASNSRIFSIVCSASRWFESRMASCSSTTSGHGMTPTLPWPGCNSAIVPKKKDDPPDPVPRSNC